MADITLSNNRLLIDKEAAKTLDIKADDRVDVRYWNENDTIFPVIGKAEVFKDTEGKRVSKKLSVSYRGQQAEVLSIYGTAFNLLPMKDITGMYIMSPVIENEDSFSEEEKDLNNLNSESTLDGFDW